MKSFAFSSLFILLLLCQFPASVAFAEVVEMPAGKMCSSIFLLEDDVLEDEAPPAVAKPRIGSITTAMGLVLGSFNGIILTATTGNFALMPEAISRWMVFFNETANVASTATGKKWIYSGSTKKIIDGIALGAMSGQALEVGAHQGFITGALTLATSIGLTYWFPNNYFHSIMHTIPKAVPGRLRVIAETKTGQGVIGLSMIVVLEKILEHSHHLIQAIPHLLFSMNVHDRAIANFSEPQVKLRHALALYFLESKLPTNLSSEDADKTLLNITGATRDGYLFTQYTVVPTNVHLDNSSKKNLISFIKSDLMLSLLTAQEGANLLAHVRSL